MAARRANQVLATVGLFAALAAARIAVDLFPAARATDALARLVVEQPPQAPADSAATPTEELASAADVVTPPVGLEAPPRKTPARAGHELARPSVRLIRAPTLPS